MEKYLNFKNLFISSCSIVAGLITSLLGGWTRGLSCLVTLMIVDYLTGMILAIVFKKSTKSNTGGCSSKVGFIGLIKKFIILLMVVVGNQVDLLLSVHYVKDCCCIGFCCNEIISIIENVGLMGIKLPKIISDSISILQKKGESENK